MILEGNNQRSKHWPERSAALQLWTGLIDVVSQAAKLRHFSISGYVINAWSPGREKWEQTGGPY